MFFDGEVDKGGLGADLWWVVRVAEFGGYVEPEVLVVLDLFVSQSDHEGTTCGTELRVWYNNECLSSDK